MIKHCKALIATALLFLGLPAAHVAQAGFLDVFSAPASTPSPPPSTKTVFITSGTTWIVPSDFSSTNTVWAKGGGAGGGGGNTGSCGAGGAGAEATTSNVSLAPGASVPISIGLGGAGGANTANSCGVAGGDTTFNTATLIAKGGAKGSFQSGGPGAIGGAGGLGSASFPTTAAHNGGNGASTPTNAAGGGGGGGAGGVDGAGANGGTIANTVGFNGGSGGGASDGGTAGGSVSGNNGTAGGTAHDSTPGGTAGAGGASPTAGGAGSHGSGGGGGGGTATAAVNGASGGVGGAGIGFTQTSDGSVAGPGGGGGGGGCGCGTTGNGGNGANGGLYGGGGGTGGAAATTNGTGGAGAPGIIIVTYTVASVPAAPVVSGPTGTVTTAAATITGSGSGNGNTITVNVDGAACTPACTTTVASNLTWTLSTPSLVNGAHTATATETNGAGTSPVSNTDSFTTNVTVAPSFTLDPADTTASIALTNSNLTSSVITASGFPQALSTVGYNTGKFHFELQLTGPGNTGQGTGIAASSHSLATSCGADTLSICLYGNAHEILLNNVALISNTNLNVNAGDLLAIEMDIGNGLFWAEDVTTGGTWNGTNANPGNGTGGVSFSPGGLNWFIDDAPVSAVVAGRSQTVNFGASPFTAPCSTGFIAWNGTTTACPTGGGGGGTGGGTGLQAAASLLPSDLPTTHWHLTARPWAPLNISPATYLGRVNTMLAWFTQHTLTSPGATQGCADGGQDPYNSDGTAAYFGSIEIPIGAQFSANNFANATIGVQAFNCSALNYNNHNPTIQDFNIGPMNLAWQLFNTFGGTNVTSNPSCASGTCKSTWLGQMNHFWGIGNNTNNWGLYDMWGAWLSGQNNPTGVFAPGGTNGTVGIDNMWNGVTSSFNQFGFNQSRQMNDPPFDLYMDQNGVTPDGLQVERQSTTILAMSSEGFNGSTAAAIKAATATAAQSGLLMQGADGSNAVGGRQDNHSWIDAGRQLTDDIMAQQLNLSQPFLAGQFQRASEMAFKQMGNYINPNCCGSGTFFATKNHFDPTLGYGTQFGAGADYGSNTQLMYFLGADYIYRNKSVVTEQPAPVEIGGYSFATNSDFGPQVVMAAGGTQMQAAMAGSTALTTFDHPTLWTALGIERIGRVGWETRLGPNASSYSSLGTQITFAPTWITTAGGSTWTRLAANPSSCRGNFTTTFANPAVTFGTIVWTCSGGPTFTQVLTMTPDGILSQTTCAGCPSTWGMTFPILAADGTTSPNVWGATTTTTSINVGGNGLISATWPSSGDSQNYIALTANTVNTFNETSVPWTNGLITPVRTWTGTATTLDATQAEFIYPAKSGEATAAQVRAGFNITGTNTYTNAALSSSVVSSNNGTYYVGKGAAGGFASTVNLNTGTIAFTSGGVPTACNFIAQLNASSQVTGIEVDRNITATYVGANGTHTNVSLTANTPVTNQ